MRRNTGNSHLKRKRRDGSPMHAYDRLPKELRDWVSSALLPWGAASVRRAYAKAYARTWDARLALRELDMLEARLVGKDAHKVWGEAHPAARTAEFRNSV
ncbi:DUF6525 family protein [Aestuariivita boseongensis]|uniref:DUF6525 family protein n=1 Tax=Aestuariivita boseongensis TaxID=1470562 RepID=UPI003CCB862B